jgi:hypothetical protein
MALTQATKELIKNLDPSQLNQAGALNGQVLTYSTTSNKWEPATSTGGGGGGGGNLVTLNGPVRAWVNFDGTKNAAGTADNLNTERLIHASFNVASVVKNDTGIYTITFATQLDDEFYCVGGSGLAENSVNGNDCIFPAPYTVATITRTSAKISFQYNTGTSDGNRPSHHAKLGMVTFTQNGTSTGNVVDNTPVGIVNWFASPTPPTGYLECNGAAVLRTSYPDLDAAIYCGNATNGIAGFGYRCTSNTNPTGTRNATGQYIVLPDLRSEFIRGWDDGRGVDTGRLFGSSQNATSIDSRPAKYSLNSPNANSGEIQLNYADADSVTATGSAPWQKSPEWTFNQTSSVFTTRPRNVALLPCIKAQKTFSSTFNLLDYIEKPATPTNGQVLMYDSSTSMWVASSFFFSSFSGFGTGYLTGVLLTPGENQTFTVPSGIKKIEIVAVGSGGNGATAAGTTVIAAAGTIQTLNIMIGTVCVPYQTITDTRFLIDASYRTNINGASRGGASGGSAWTRGVIGYAAGGGAGGWVKKTLDVTAGDVFTYTTGIVNRESTISKGTWSMTGGTGGTSAGGTIAGDYDQGFAGEAGEAGGTGTGLGGRQRDLDGNFGSIFGGYIFIKIVT